MKVKALIQPGDRIEIVELMRKEAQIDIPTVYMSKVLDISENGEIEIAMPTDKGKLVLLPLGVRYEFTFISSTNMYRATALVKERYKKDNLAMLKIELKSQLQKHQRREFYRYPCIFDVDYYKLKEEETKSGNGEAIYAAIESRRIEEEEGIELFSEDASSKELFRHKTKCTGQAIDLSAGGLRFAVEGPLEKGDYLLLLLELKSGANVKEYYLIGCVVSCDQTVRAGRTCYDVRLRFLIRDKQVREEIVRYVFEEERKARQIAKK